jgi:hypothetical protein
MVISLYRSQTFVGKLLIFPFRQVEGRHYSQDRDASGRPLRRRLQQHASGSRQANVGQGTT